MNFLPRSLAFFACVCTVLALATSCSQEISEPEEFTKYISAYTFGVVPADMSIVVEFASPIDSDTPIGVPLSSDIMNVGDLDGELILEHEQRLVFTPASPMNQGASYTASLNLSALFSDVPNDLEVFSFAFEIMQQRISVSKPYYKVNYQDADRVTVYFNIDMISAAAIADTADIITEANMKYDSLSLYAVGKRNMRVGLHGIEKPADKQVMTFTVNAEVFKATGNKEMSVTIPGKFDFYISGTRSAQSPQSVTIEFSDAIDADVDIRGLIVLENAEFTYEVEDNTIHLFPSTQIAGDRLLTVHEGIVSQRNRTLETKYQTTVRFTSHKPEVVFADNKVIYPVSDRITIPIKAVSLTDVDVLVIETRPHRMGQYLLENRMLRSSNNLRRLAKPVLYKRVSLGERDDASLNSWQHYDLDITEIPGYEPGAMYRIVVGFRPSYALYDCDEAGELVDDMVEVPDFKAGEYSWLSYSGASSKTYSWENRNNPCTSEYYHSDRWAQKNILVSDIGLIAKAGAETTHVYAMSLTSAKTLAGVSIVVLDNQLDTLLHSKTDNNGLVSWSTSPEAMAVIAKHNNSVSYLKLSSANQLSMSNFDVSGVGSQSGIRAFMYGERGVWRPGDTIFMTCMVEDRLNSLPQDHPATISLFDPLGTKVGTFSPTNSKDLVYAFALPTRNEDKTGQWRLEFQIGNNSFMRYVRVETVKPNRLSVDLSFESDTLALGNESIRADLHAEWLHGGRLGAQKAKYECRIVPQRLSFNTFPNFVFDNAGTSRSSSFKPAWEGMLNYAGDAVVKPDLNEDMIKSFSRIDFRGKVYEPSGAFSVDFNSVYVSPYSSYVGFRLPETESYYYFLDTTYAIPIRTVDIQGNASATKRVRARVYKVQWRWWWNSSHESTRDYIRRESVTPIVDEEVDITNGKGLWNVTMPNTGYGRYYVEVEDMYSGHVASTHMYLDWPWWYDVRDRKDVTGGEQMLSISLDKEKYQTGDEITLRFPSSDGSKALVTIESGDNVVHQQWHTCKKGTNEIVLPAKAEYAPNVYAHVMLIQPFARRNDQPIRLYGVVPVFVENPASRLSPLIKTNSEVRPESTMKVEVSEKNGKGMTYTLAVVDEGLLDLTNYKTPRPWRYFYQRRSLGVRTWDVYDDVANVYSDVLSRVVAIGGGGSDEAEGESSSRGKRFKPMVRYVGPFTLKAGESATHTIEVPRYIGKVRAMVVARQGKAYGSAEQQVQVKSPIMVASTLPRALSPGDTINVPVTVFHMRKTSENVQLRLRVEGPMKVVGNGHKTIAFAGESDTVVTYTCVVKEETGFVKCTVTAEASGERATEVTDLTVRVPERARTVVASGIAEPAWDSRISPYGLAGTRSAFLEVSTVPDLNLTERLEELLRYPYGCIEQTTSKAFPQLFVGDLVSLTEEMKERIRVNISAAQDRLLLFQTSDGGLSYWPGGSTSKFGSVYALHFLAEAKARGYVSNENLLNKLIVYNERLCNEWYNSSDGADEYLQAYRLYVLAKLGSAQIGAMNRLKSNVPSGSARWWLAGAYALAGKVDIGKQIANDPTVNNEYVYLPSTFGSSHRYSSITGIVLSELDLSSAARNVVQPLVKVVGDSRRYMSTQSTAFALIALSKVFGGSDKQLVVDVSIGGKLHQVRTAKTIHRIDFDANLEGDVSVRSQGERVFVRVVQTGTPISAIASAVAEGMNFRVRYHDDEGNSIDVSELVQGTEFWVEFKVKDSFERNMRNMALDFRLPCGWEIVDDKHSSLSSTSRYDYRDIRDDRANIFFPMRRNYERTYRLRLHASFVGAYYLPSIYTGEMYDGDTDCYLGSSVVRVVSE